MRRFAAVRRPLVYGALTVGLLAGCITYYRSIWPSYDAFSRNIDPSCMVTYCDFTLFYYKQAGRIYERDAPVRKYFYSPTFALMLRPIGKLPLESAYVAWSVIQALSVGVLLWASCLLLRARDFPNWTHVLVLFLTLTCYPILSNWKWGQTSTPIVALLAMALACIDRGRTRLGVVTLAVAIAARYYPAIYACALLARRQYRAAAWLALLSVLLLIGWPVLALGAEHTWNFYQASYAQLDQANREWISVSRWTQYVPTVVQRLPRRWFAKGALGPRELWVYISLFIAACNFALCVWVIPKRVPRPTTWIFCFIALSTPLLVPTCWTHYFAYLPLVQAFLASELVELHGRWVTRLIGFAFAVLPSVTLSSVFYFETAENPQEYIKANALLLSNTLLLVLAYVVLALRRAESTDHKCCAA